MAVAGPVPSRPSPWRRLGGIAGLLVIALGLAGMGHTAVPRPRVSVLVIGGSAADGWLDRTHEGYVVRGLRDYAQAQRVRAQIENHAIPGARVVNPLVRRSLGRWLAQAGPHAVVVLAWGLLNDLERHTPTDAVRAALARQIALVLAHHDTVLLVTPPATRASYWRFPRAEPRLVQLELAVAQRFHSPHLFIDNVFSAERAYLAAHDMPIAAVTRGPFHPNTAGATLGGRLLAQRLDHIWKRPPLPPSHSAGARAGSRARLRLH